MSDADKDFMSNMLLFVEIFWVAGVAVIFILYFVVKWRIRKNKEAERQARDEERTD